MKKNNLKPVAVALGSTIVLAMSAPLSAADNPFQMMEFGAGVKVAAEARDMQGNKVNINDETGFKYGGDEMGAYAGGKVGTGAKDSSVCGTFAGSSCSVAHLEGKGKK